MSAINTLAMKIETISRVASVAPPEVRVMMAVRGMAELYSDFSILSDKVCELGEKLSGGTPSDLEDAIIKLQPFVSRMHSNALIAHIFCTAAQAERELTGKSQPTSEQSQPIDPIQAMNDIIEQLQSQARPSI